MSGFFRWIFAIFGFRYGLYGAIAGFFIGWMVDSYVLNRFWNSSSKESNRNNNSTANLNAFVRSLIILTAAVMKADGTVIKVELDYVKAFFRQQFGEDIAKNSLLYLRDILKQQLPINQACSQIRSRIDYASKIHLLHYLFGLANTKGSINPNELNIIEYISNNIGISRSDFQSVKSAFIKGHNANEIDSAYKILEVSPTASNDEVKKAYRRMAVKYHPDKASQLSEKEQKTSEEQFKKINNAFEEIKRQREIGRAHV